MLQILIKKIASGKFLLTLIIGIVFAYCSIKKQIPEEAIVAIIMYVVQAYFNRKKEEEK